jgi:hypothetical protein
MSALLLTRFANTLGAQASSRERLAEPARMRFATIAAFLQSLLQTRGGGASPGRTTTTGLYKTLYDLTNLYRLRCQ